jgi:hypothetical protein
MVFLSVDFHPDRALRRACSGGPLFAFNPGGSWVDEEMGLRTDPYLDRHFRVASRGRHRECALLAPFYGQVKLWRVFDRRWAFDRQIQIRVAGLWVGFEVVRLSSQSGLSG